MRAAVSVALLICIMLRSSSVYAAGALSLHKVAGFVPAAPQRHGFLQLRPKICQQLAVLPRLLASPTRRPLVMTVSGNVGNLLVGLNQAQTQAVTAPHGPTIVLAGPGSGKTRVLTHRIGYLLGQGVRAEQIMAVTFTNKAANEMKKRIKAMLGVQMDADLKMTVGTFHGICVRLLREFAEDAGLDPNFLIFDDKQQEKLIEEALEQLNMDPKEFVGIRFTVSRLKSEGLAPEEVFKSKSVAVGAEDDWRNRYLSSVRSVYEAYQKLLTVNNAVDFDDLLLKMRQLLQTNADVRTLLQDRYRHLLVDEWQDTNVVQYDIVKLLAIEPRSASVFVVGDADQSIYAFRGADIRNVRQFIKDFGAEQVLLETNYRSTNPIAASAQALIENNVGRVKKDVRVCKSRGAPVKVFEAQGDRQEAQFVASELLRLARSGEVADGFRDMAVMYRTNRQSRAIEEVLVRSGIPYHLVGGKKFYERKEVRDILAYLRVIANPADNESLFRIINVPTRGIGKVTENKIKDLGARLLIPCYEILQRMRKLQASKLMREEEAAAAKAEVSRADFEVADVEAGMAELEAALGDLHTAEQPFHRPSREDQAVEALSESLTGKSRQGVLEFAEVIEFLTDIAAHCTPAELIDSLLRVTKYQEFLQKDNKADNVEDRLENLMELKDAATLVEMEGIEGLVEFLTTVVLDREEEDKEEIDIDVDVMKKPHVKLMTLHASKGLEFTAVFIVGLEDDCLPHSRCAIKGKKNLDKQADERRRAQQRENFEEERRLTYVGMTRAKERLYLGFKKERRTFGKHCSFIDLHPSRFLSEMIPARPELFDISMVSDESAEKILSKGEGEGGRGGGGRGGAWSGPSPIRRGGGRRLFATQGPPVTRRMSGSELAGGGAGVGEVGRGNANGRGSGWGDGQREEGRRANAGSTMAAQKGAGRGSRGRGGRGALRGRRGSEGL